MVKSVATGNDSLGPVRTIELLDPRTRTVKKFTNTTEAVDKYLKDARTAEKEMLGDASYGSLAVGTAGFCARLLYDGIKKSKFYFGKALTAGVFMGIVGFGAIAGLEYKRKISKVADDFMKDCESKFMQKDFEGVKFKEYLDKVSEEKEKKEELKENTAAEPKTQTEDKEETTPVQSDLKTEEKKEDSPIKAD